MSHLPKFVRDRLKASVSLDGHPDPDLLTAFSECSLPAHERALVMDHLARCGDCRDVVALALPATEAVPETARVARRHWFRWPVLRWGALAAGILIIASVGVEQYREHHQNLAAFVASKQTAQNGRVQDQIARNEAPGTDAQKDEFRPSTPASQPARERSQTEAAVAGKAPAPVEPASSGLSARAKSYRVGTALGGPVVKGVGGIGAANQLSNNQQINQLATNSPQNNSFVFNAGKSVSSAQPKPLAPTRSTHGAAVPAASEMVEVQAGAGAPLGRKGQRQDQGQQPDLKQAQQQPADIEQAHASSEGDKALSKAKPATEQVEVTAAAPAIEAGSSPEPVLTARNTASLAGPTWSITATGGLQRSLDKGKTWQDVSVTASPAAVSRLMTEQVAVYGYEKKSHDKKKDAKAAKQRASGSPVFRAVAANGLDVWAGGSAGALFHSADAGDHWTRIFPLAGSTLLTADITAIQFPDPQQGTVTTATSEVWTTIDAGASWQKH